MMKKVILFLALLMPLAAYPQPRTLRLDYSFCGDARCGEISLCEMRSLGSWAGRDARPDEVPLRGNGQLTMRDSSGTVLYRSSFSSLFQEWQTTEEATRLRRSFENVFLVPMPSGKAEITIELFDTYGKTSACLTHQVDPADILIRPATAAAECRDLHISGPVGQCIDVVIVAEGYTAAEMEVFYADAYSAVHSILSLEPFKSLKDRFNFRAAGIPSCDSGVSIPGKNIWKETPLHSHFDTFYSGRYLTTLHVRDLHDAIAGIPYEHIIILANTDNYGGGGIYNSYTFTAAHHAQFKPVVAHEFGHSFAGLADEYYYDDQFSDYYHSDCEPWEQNITTLYDFPSKWEDMLGTKGVSLYEGAGYKSKGVWRGCKDCRMKTNGAKGFCPVCQRAIERIIRFYTD